MNIILAGENTETRFLARALKLKKHHVTVVSRNEPFCKLLADEYEVTAVCGDAQNLQILSEACAEGTDLLVAMEEKDAANLLLCEIVKKQFPVRTMAVIKDSQNTELFYEMGVDRCVCITDFLTDMIETVGGELDKS